MKESKKILESLPIDQDHFDAQEALDWMSDDQFGQLYMSNETCELQNMILHIISQSDISNNTLKRLIKQHRTSLINGLERIWNANL